MEIESVKSRENTLSICLSQPSAFALCGDVFNLAFLSFKVFDPFIHLSWLDIMCVSSVH